MFDCTTCTKSFKHNYQLNKHLNRKYPCEAIKHPNEYLYIIQTADCIQNTIMFLKLTEVNNLLVLMVIQNVWNNIQKIFRNEIKYTVS